MIFSVTLFEKVRLVLNNKLYTFWRGPFLLEFKEHDFHLQGKWMHLFLFFYTIQKEVLRHSHPLRIAFHSKQIGFPQESQFICYKIIQHIENLLRNSEVICFLESINIFNCSFCSSINFIMNLLFSWIKVIISFISKNVLYNLYLLLKFVRNSFFNVWDSKLTAEGFIKKV